MKAKIVISIALISIIIPTIAGLMLHSRAPRPTLTLENNKEANLVVDKSPFTKQADLGSIAVKRPQPVLKVTNSKLLKLQQPKKKVVIVKTTKGCEQYRAIVARYNWNVNVALAIMRAESGCNPNARHVNANGSVDSGLFQLNKIAVYDPAENIRIAYVLKYSQRGWQPWTVYKTGAYLQYLN